MSCDDLRVTWRIGPLVRQPPNQALPEAETFFWMNRSMGTSSLQGDPQNGSPGGSYLSYPHGPGRKYNLSW
jgi:hypothetical protein